MDEETKELERTGASDDDEDTFASDFYRSGTDWSCLNMDDSTPATVKRQRAVKQSNLFQCWGLNKQPSTSNFNGGTGTARQSNLFQCWGLSQQPSTNISGGISTTRTENYEASGSGAAGSNPNTKRHQQHPRACPFYKKISGTPFTVDAFRYGHIDGCSAYFLSHFHADHYGGLNKAWCHGPIYCTPITAGLVRMCLYVDPLIIHTLDIGIEYVIEGIKVTMLEANHCPGAALIHFRLPDGQCHLHTGDFRASKHMQTYPTLLNSQVNLLYLDTTYCNTKYRFPAKEDVLDFVVSIVKDHIETHPKTLIVVGAYSIGKECVYLAICQALGFKIHANASRRRILHSFGWPELSDNLCTNGKETPLHVLPISSLKFEVLEKYLQSYGSQYSMVLAFRPTGWTYSETTGSQLGWIKPKVKSKVTMYGVPYSEHSSFTELQEFVQFLRPKRIIPTVNVGSATNRDKMQSYFQQWLRVQP
ncbi:snm1-like protein [Orobanche minor]